jgi:Na+/proline symporter
VSYIFPKYGAPAQATVVVSIVISQICLAARLILLRRMIGLSPKKFLVEVYIKVLAVAAAAMVLPLLMDHAMPDGFAGFCLSVLLCVACACVSIFYLGCSKDERKEMISMILSGIGR